MPGDGGRAGAGDARERERLTTLGGLAAMSLDALSSVAYGPEAILVVLVTAGVSAIKFALPITLLEIGQVPPPPVRSSCLVVVPVAGMSRLTAEAVSAALSLGDEVIAVTVVFADPDEESADTHFRQEWHEWRPEVPLLSLRSEHRSLAPPLVEYLKAVEAEDKYHRLVVLIPEVAPSRPWLWLLHNRRGVLLDRAIRKGTANVVLCRLRFRLDTLTR